MKSKPAAFWRVALSGLGLSLALGAHPMGNFSVNHYSRLSFHDGRAEIAYVLDLAEIPAFQLLNQWGIDWKDQAMLDAKSQPQARQWVSNLSLVQAGRRLPLQVISVTPKATEGAGGMPVLRISIAASADVEPGAVTYRDANYPGRAGWKEIVLDPDKDISHGLTYYPTDPGITPPQDLTALVKVGQAIAPASRLTQQQPSAVEALPPASPLAPQQPSAKGQALPPASPLAPQQPTAKGQALPPASPFTQQQPSGPGSVVRGDYLSTLLQHRNLTWQLTLLGILAAFGLGAMHAMSPGHGKTIVAAYLVGSRGTLKHAGLLGLVVTFTHTFTVFLLGLGVLFFQQYVVPEKIVPVLGVVSGLSIVTVGLTLLYRRSMALLTGGHGHFHFPGSHTHSHQYSHSHSGHDSQSHTHMPEGPITLTSLIALGVSGGLVPCPSALILMLSAIALGSPGLGLVLLLGFSSGLAAVLMAIGMLALYARNLLPDAKTTSKRALFQLIPVFSAVIVICLGLAMSAVSAGWIQPMRFLS